MFFRSSHKKSDVCLVLDIGNASLAGSLVLFEQGKLPEALYTIRVPLSISAHPHPEKLHTILENELEQVLELLHTKGFEHGYFANHEKKVEKILCAYASPWYVSKTKKVIVTNPKPFFVTKDFLNDVLAKEIVLFQDELASGVYGEEFKSEIVVMEQTIIDVRINGYSVQSPIGQKTTECDVVLYLGIGSRQVFELVQGLIIRFFPHEAENSVSHSFPLIAHTAIQKIFPHEKDYVLIDVTGEVTDVTHVHDGVIGDTISFPSGKFFLLRKLMKGLDVPTEVALSFLHLWQMKGLSTEMETTIKEILVDIEHEWSIYLEDALSRFKDIHLLPEKVYLTADTDVAPIFVDFLKTQHTDLTAVWRRGLTIVHMSEEILKQFYNSPSHLMFDECVALDSIFLHHFQ